MAKTPRIRSCAPVPESYRVQVCATRRGAPGKQINGPDDVCRLLKNAKNGDRESFFTIYLDTKNRVVGIDETHKGTLAEVGVHPREVFKGAIAANAFAVIAAHNHPSGDSTPSPEDFALTQRLAAAGKLVGIPVLDHIVVGQDDCASIRESQSDLFGAGGRGLYRPVPRSAGVSMLYGRPRPRPRPRPGPRPGSRSRSRTRRR